MNDVRAAADWDPIGEEAVRDPMAAQAELRSRCPVAWTDQLGGFWALTRYDDIAWATRNADTFINSGSPVLGVPRPPLEVDKPVHTAYRRAMQPYFGERRMEKLQPRIRGFVKDLLRPLLDAGGGDIAPVFTYPLPARVLCALLNIPDEDWSNIKAWSEEVFQSEQARDGDGERMSAANATMGSYARHLVESRRNHPLHPADDLVSGLLAAEVGERRLSEDEVTAVVRLLLTAGHNSTTSALGISILHIAGDPEVQRRLRDDPDLIPAAVDEFLRHETPVMAMPRWATRDVEVGGRAIRAGEQVFLVWASGNRDEDRFPNADRCVIDRQPNPHLVFGRGIHKCLGQPLALLELKIAIEELLRATTWIDVAGPVNRTGWVRYGVSSLPVAFG